MSHHAFFFSCWKIKPAAATILAVSYVFVDLILDSTQLLKRCEFPPAHPPHGRVGDDISWAEVTCNLSALRGDGRLFALG